MSEEGKHFSIARVLFLVAVGFFAAWFFFGSGLQRQAELDPLSSIEQQIARGVQSAYDQVARDTVIQYEMASRSGTPIDVCVQAGLVTAAYLQAKDEPNYARWKSVEAADCRKAGVPR